MKENNENIKPVSRVKHNNMLHRICLQKACLKNKEIVRQNDGDVCLTPKKLISNMITSTPNSNKTNRLDASNFLLLSPIVNKKETNKKNMSSASEKNISKNDVNVKVLRNRKILLKN